MYINAAGRDRRDMRTLLKMLSAGVLTALVMTGCSSSKSSKTSAAVTTTTGSGAATGTPIVLGAVGTNSGTVIFPESMTAAKAVFDRLNKNGGINGHPIQYLVEDDGDDAEEAAKAAKRLVEQNKVLGLVGGASSIDCSVNAQYYASKSIYSLPGLSACADAPTVAPVSTGPFVGLQMTMSYMVDTVKADPLCLSGLNVPLMDHIKNVVVPQWEKASGHNLKEIITGDPNEDLTAAVIKARVDGCKGVVLFYTERNLAPYFQIARAQGVLDGQIKYGMLSSGYSYNLLARIPGLAEGAVVNSDFLPFSDPSDKIPEVDDFRHLMVETGQVQTSFAEAGYISANIAIAALKTIQGDYTVESVGNAFKSVKYTSALLGAPFTWGQQPNASSKMLQIKGNKFVTASEWVQFQPK